MYCSNYKMKCSIKLSFSNDEEKAVEYNHSIYVCSFLLLSQGNCIVVLFKNSFCFHSQPHLVILQVSTTECNITWRRMKPAILPSACLIVFYLIVEVTGFSQTVNGEKTLPHSTSQAWRYTHPDKSLNLKTQQGWKGRKDVCLNPLHGKTIWKIISKTLLGFFCFFFAAETSLTWLLQIKLAPFQ